MVESDRDSMRYCGSQGNFVPVKMTRTKVLEHTNIIQFQEIGQIATKGGEDCIKRDVWKMEEEDKWKKQRETK